MSSIKLGDKIRDSISGFIGIASARHEYLNGCVRWSIAPIQMKDGKPIETHVFDEQQIEIIAAAADALPEPKRAVGGPYNEPSRPAVPSR